MNSTDADAGRPRVYELDSAIRDYAWGSPTAIPELLGLVPTGEPAAELWLGAHPDEPSRWRGHPQRPGLDELIASDPAGLLGEATAAAFGGRLPFLLKLLAAGKALSIQVHPTLEQARAGYAEEERRGVPQGSPQRNYRDDNHKPELLCALTPFQAFCGFRPVPETLEFLDALAGAGSQLLGEYRALLAGPDGLRVAFTALLTTSVERRQALVDDAVTAAGRLAEAGGPWAAAAAGSVLAAGDFPGDIGAVLALLLNYVQLQPGEAIFLGAGNVHAYLRGLGVEILANSDNVLRCGLTPKHVDVPELLKVADFVPLADPLSPVALASPATAVYPVPVSDFLLSRLTPAAGEVILAADRPHLLIVTEGSVVLAADGQSQEASRGSAVFVAAGQSPVTVSGSGLAFAATVNLA
ncbi:MAG: mannose-6-phosphate isomerase [Pseudonocardiales bacterium]|nr:mannose-6-phosphate isomerase [Pseudonocardiales bacterium]